MAPSTLAASLVVAALLLQSHGVQSTTRTLQLHRNNTDISIKRNLHTHERHRRLDDGRYEVVPLNLGMGTHYTWIYAGTPPQRASVIVDTGSHQLAFPCKGCTGCGKHTDAPFDAAKSSTLTYPTCDEIGQEKAITCASCTDANTCVVSQMYSEGSSWKAVVVEDNVWLGDSAVSDVDNKFSTRYRFGCQNHETGLFTTQVADGIMGLSTKVPNVVKKLFLEDKINQNVFSLCFTPTGGAMTVGSHLNTAHLQENMTFAQVSFDSTGWYALEVRGIRIHGEDIHIDSPRLLNGGRKVIVDSGTTDSYLPAALNDEFNRVFKTVVGKEYITGGTEGYTKDEIELLPTIEYVLAGVDGNDVVMSIPPTRYLKKKAGRYFSTILLDEAGGGIVGASLMMHHEFVFDAERNRVGFAKANCEFEQMPTSDAVNEAVVETKGSHDEASIDEASEDDYPLVLTLGGVAIGLLFIVGIAVAVCKSKDPRWTQVNLDEFEEEEVELVTEKGAEDAAVEQGTVASYDTPPDVDDEFFNAQLEEAVDGVDKAVLHRMDV
ncbi:hypothetical protein H310_11845 [Aphanomyces invadans]|uniref:Peptidase A1 domain-containing protein n=1 Tax=Aphanomyces invadans TaxID=157072 RepID=A0A024TMJ9_9STRA|nr:hypothetical protein H310_11845 [Aphanomyces invadans]ETV94567.1 hypothetical protein H310_11845 [Aphanomyces invadans]|eukprot:XP_008876882.1 hypothetical protein H310_11845 [Aphanomyces invadans]